MRKAIGVAIFFMALGIFVMLLVRDRFVGLILIAVLCLAGYACVFDC